MVSPYCAVVQIGGGGGTVGAAGVVANLAVDGSLYDYNLIADTSCAGLTNPYSGTLTLYRSGLSTGNRYISIMSNPPLGNLNLVTEEGAGFELQHHLTVHDLTFTNKLNLIM